MKQLLVLSGKGGTGKTTVASALIKLSNARAFADCDIDAPNLHLVIGMKNEPERNDYFGLPKAKIDMEKCIACGACISACRFDAISEIDGIFSVDNFACEGCGVCGIKCAANAVSLYPDDAGERMLYKDKDRLFSTARLKMGSGTSGKLVSAVKKQLREEVQDDVEFSIVDGSPGIGCPVIASMSGADIVLIVAEPSVSGINDMKRILETAETFWTKSVVCINKYDINVKMTELIEEYCHIKKIPLIGKIPFDKQAVIAVNEGSSVVDFDCISGNAIRRIYDRIVCLYLKSKGEIAE